ncbi:MAG: pyruvate/2-oxoglutarate dehydrogenase complex dihydrolipoamide acyltransferase (E2) component [Myxococcota bacterium]|jgi:pyruvate/2-oxoglutarate dehydrogenase complex dihydrolipoamide acyltransferase (E2) component
MPQKPSVIREFLLWWFAPPYSPWVSTSVAIDFTDSRSYLARLAEQDGPKVSIQHLLTAAIGRALADFPDANSRVIGGKIVPSDQVAVAMPVNLLGHKGGKDRELSAAIVEHADTRSLRDIADRTRKTIAEERDGRVTNPIGRWLMRGIKHLPGPAIRRSLDLMDRAAQQAPIAERLFAQMPITTGLTNPGATLANQEGILFRGAALNLPGRLMHLGTVWAVSAVQDEVIPVNGVPAVRPMLPVVLVFDHRLIDGVRASRLILRLRGVLGDPEEEFGEDGLREG